MMEKAKRTGEDDRRESEKQYDSRVGSDTVEMPGTKAGEKGRYGSADERERVENRKEDGGDENEE